MSYQPPSQPDIRLGGKCHERSDNLGKIADEISDLNTACIANGFTAMYLFLSMVPGVLCSPSKHAESYGDATAKAAEAAEDNLWEEQARVPWLFNTPKRQHQLYRRLYDYLCKNTGFILKRCYRHVFTHKVHAMISLHISKEVTHFVCPPMSPTCFLVTSESYNLMSSICRMFLGLLRPHLRQQVSWSPVPSKSCCVAWRSWCPEEVCGYWWVPLYCGWFTPMSNYILKR